MSEIVTNGKMTNLEYFTKKCGTEKWVMIHGESDLSRFFSTNIIDPKFKNGVWIKIPKSCKALHQIQWKLTRPPVLDLNTPEIKNLVRLVKCKNKYCDAYSINNKTFYDERDPDDCGNHSWEEVALTTAGEVELFDEDDWEVQCHGEGRKPTDHMKRPRGVANGS